MRNYKHQLWNELKAHASELSSYSMEHLYQCVPQRDTRFQQSSCGITYDFSKQRVTEKTLSLLLDLAKASELKQAINDLFSGEQVNISEKRPALHTALRDMECETLWVDGVNVMPLISDARMAMEDIANKVRSQTWLGYSGKAIKDVVNIGMGGSDLGMKFCINALYDKVHPDLNFHFISDVDPEWIERLLRMLSPETTLFIVSSKSFTTKETLHNAKRAMMWIGDVKHKGRHFIGVTAYPDRAHAFGIKTVLPIWDWVGGRFSICSAVNLSTMIAIGPEHFRAFLSGAHVMDLHFRQTPFENNLPVLAAMFGIWNINFNHLQTLLMLVYSNRLESFVQYIQQLDMESNGKSLDKQNKPVSYDTGPMVWGGHGNRAQHSYYQLLCQGTHRVAVDFITLKTLDEHMVNDFSRAKQEILAHGVRAEAEPSQQILGKMPMSHIQLDVCSPYTLGALVSLYEHKTYTQGVIWNINSFDQPGVESAKKYQSEQLDVI